jgi:hypothetical protein
MDSIDDDRAFLNDLMASMPSPGGPVLFHDREMDSITWMVDDVQYRAQPVAGTPLVLFKHVAEDRVVGFRIEGAAAFLAGLRNDGTGK